MRNKRSGRFEQAAAERARRISELAAASKKVKPESKQPVQPAEVDSIPDAPKVTNPYVRMLKRIDADNKLKP